MKTKLNMPVLRESVITRQRLLDQLNADLMTAGSFARKLTLISAPAGYGKTTAVVAWLVDFPGQVLWLSLDDEDNDPVRFIAYLVAAFQKVDGQVGDRTMKLVRAQQPPAAETLITPLINDILGLDSPLILALDDYHLIQNPRIHSLVSYFLEHQPDHLHQVVLTREDPLLPISRMLSRGQALEIRQDELRFTKVESGEFLSRTMGVKLPRAEVEALQRRTEGWIAGLQFAALSLHGQANMQDFVHLFSGSNRYILDYLFEEVFNQQPEPIQDFLVRTSILSQLNAELCNAVVERDDSREILVELEKANLFMVPLDLSRSWYRYHRLFRDLLRHRLRIQEASLEADLHLKASQWYEAKDMQAEAVQHSLWAKDWGRGSELVLGISNQLMKQGEIHTLVAWFNQFPEEIIRSHPEMSMEYSWVLILTGQNEEAERWLAHVDTLSKDIPQLQGSLLGAQAFLARTKGDTKATIGFSEQALSLIPEDDLEMRGILAINLGITYWHVGQMQQAEKTLREAEQLSQETGNEYALISSIVFLGRVQAVHGNLKNAVRTLEQAIEKGGNAPISGLAHLDLASLHYEWNELNTCREHLEAGQAINKMSGNTEFLAAGYMLETLLERALGNRDRTQAALNQVRDVVQSGVIPAPNHNRCLAFLIEMALRENDVLTAQQLAEALEMDVDAHPFYRYNGLAKERLLIAQNKKSEAVERLQEKIKIADRANWGYGSIAARILESTALEDQEASFDRFIEALTRSEPEGYLRIFADHGQVVAKNLLKAAQRGLLPNYVKRLLECIRQDEVLETTALNQVEQLSERELEVLRLIAVGLSNREIAEQLYLSPGTIKTHVHNICGKLGVSNRTQAVVHARDLKLI